jgi:hypothetical protein
MEPARLAGSIVTIVPDALSPAKARAPVRIGMRSLGIFIVFFFDRVWFFHCSQNRFRIQAGYDNALLKNKALKLAFL